MEFMQHVVDEERSTTSKSLGQMRHQIKECLQAEKNMTKLIEQINQAKT